ncbi:MAG: hypothetical protein HC769_00385 [Cyanobacteria bacterium CRU_2_1]|nr:hypothetical protein [Cyanobacteria bacterium RU_5_0]NJR57431.1 hypothetical protein [Cyanobacteria bacterium CRU_2_1]
MVALLTARQVTWLDTGLYHYSVIQWLAQFGSVPGVALLFANFGFTSSWFAFAAPLNAEILDDRVSAVTNGFILLITVVHFLICLNHSLKHQQFSDALMITFLLMLVPIVARLDSLLTILVSPSPDIPVLLLVGVVTWAISLISDAQMMPELNTRSPVDNSQIIPLFLSAGAVTFKLTALPLLFVASLYVIFNQRFEARKLLIAGIILVALLTPLLLSGIVTSGCPLYPSSFLCLDLPWSASTEDIQSVAKSTHQWTNWYGSPPSGVNPWLWSLWVWFRSSGRNQLMSFFIVIAIVSMTYSVRTTFVSRAYQQLWLVAIGVAGITFIMSTSPFFRFGAAYLILLPALATTIYIWVYPNNLFSKLASQYHVKQWRKILLIFLLFMITLIAVDKTNHNFVSRFILPPPIRQVQIVRKQVNDIIYFSPSADNSTDRHERICWATELPCAFEVPQDVKLRNPEIGIRGGFVRQR